MDSLMSSFPCLYHAFIQMTSHNHRQCNHGVYDSCYGPFWSPLSSAVWGPGTDKRGRCQNHEMVALGGPWHLQNRLNRLNRPEDFNTLKLLQFWCANLHWRSLEQFWCWKDFNSNDAFPLLAEYRKQFLTYNDDIQGAEWWWPLVQPLPSSSKSVI